MADNEMVKIVFDFDLGNVPASAKKFGEYLKNIQTDSKEAENQLKQLGSAVDQTARKMDSAGGSIKKSNQQWTNFALILQDLPYGFRGIQNNLPAVIGGFAGMTGPIYLATSAIIAFFTAYDMGLFKSIGGVNQFQEANKKAIDSIKQEATDIVLLVEQYKKSNTSSQERVAIIKKLNDLNPQYFGNLNAENTSIKLLNDAYLAYVGNLGNVIKAKRLEEKLTKYIEQRLKYEYEAGIALLKSGYRNPELINQQNAALKKYNMMLQQEADIAKEITDLTRVKVDLDNKKKDKKSKEDPNYYTKIIQQEQKTFTDSLDNELKYAEDNNSKKLSILENYTSDLNHWHELGFIEESFYLNKSADLYKQIYDTKKSIAQESSKQSVYFAKKQSSEIETQLNIEDKLNKGNLNKRIEYTKQAMAKVAILAATSFDPAAMSVFLEMFDKLNAKLSGLGTTLIQFNQSLTTIINSTLTDLGTALGEGLGNIFAEKGGLAEMLNSFITILADGLISIGKLAIQTGITLLGLEAALKTLGGAGAIVVGVAAVALGTFMKGKIQETSKFANGGIISGPTMGLMGEYPGASSNPEVVAPLDKLKSIIGEGGGGGGTFVLRGQDLLLSVQKAQKFSKLKGQNINLV